MWKGDMGMEIKLYAISGIPLIQSGDNIGQIICGAAKKEGFLFQDGDIVVITSKIVSKAEGRLVDTQKVKPSEKTLELAQKISLEAAQLEVILGETRKLLRIRPDVLLTEDRLGFISTKAGVDSSNTAPGPKGRILSLLPRDPDASARKIRETIQAVTKKKIAIVINDTFGRPYRTGSVGMAIGISGIAALYSEGDRDLFGRKRHPLVSQVDEIAAAASLLMGQTTQRRPVVVVRGVKYQPSETDTILSVLRPYEEEILEIAEQIKKNQ